MMRDDVMSQEMTFSQAVGRFHAFLYAFVTEHGRVQPKELDQALILFGEQLKGGAPAAIGVLRPWVKRMLKQISALVNQIFQRWGVLGEAFLRAYYGSPVVDFYEDRSYVWVARLSQEEAVLHVALDQAQPEVLSAPLKKDLLERGLSFESASRCVCAKIVVWFHDAQQEIDFERLRGGTTMRLGLQTVHLAEPVPHDPIGAPTGEPERLGDIGSSASDEQEGVRYIGSVAQKDNQPMILSSRKDQINGYVRDQHKSEVMVNDILVLESMLKPERQIFVRVQSISGSDRGATIVTKKINEFVTSIVMEPFREVAEGYEGDPRMQDLNGFGIRHLTPAEAQNVLYLPELGVPLGSALVNRDLRVPFSYPLEPFDTPYQSFLIMGAQGSGKTNFIRLLARAFTGYQGLPAPLRPAVVILDGEGDLSQFPSGTQLASDTKAFLAGHRIQDPNVTVLTIANEQGDTSLSLQELPPGKIAYLMQELPKKSTAIFETILEKVATETPLQERTWNTIRDKLLMEVRRNQIIHMSQKEAIIRAMYSAGFKLFDQPNTQPLCVTQLLQPGRITVINVFGLDDDQKRLVALYLLFLFDCYKMNSSSVNPGLLFVIDEAHRLFPYRPNPLVKDYIERISAQVQNIVHRGRKRRYGVVLAIHNPHDIYTPIAELCNTKIAFRLLGADVWINRIFGPAFVNPCHNLPTGTCLISLQGTGHLIQPLQLETPNLGG